MTQQKTQRSKFSIWANRFRELYSVFGIRGVIEYLLWSKVSPGLVSVSKVHPRLALHPLGLRWGTSDYFVYRQIFVNPEYACVDDLPDVRLVIDCGANVGYSTAYFLTRFPDCQVIAVEPDPANFAMLQRNTASYRDRVKLVHAGVWSHSASLALSKERYGDGLEWSRQVRLCKADEKPDFEGVGVGSLLDGSGHNRISLLKIDVEGAEAVIFSENFESWLDRVDAIAIELHDDSVFGKASEVFFSAISGRGFEVSHSGQLTICRRPPPSEERSLSTEWLAKEGKV